MRAIFLFLLLSNVCVAQYDAICEVDGATGVAISQNEILTLNPDNRPTIIFHGENGRRLKVQGTLKKTLTNGVSVIQFTTEAKLTPVEIGDPTYGVVVKGFDGFRYTFYTNFYRPEVYDNSDGFAVFSVKGKLVGFIVDKRVILLER